MIYQLQHLLFESAQRYPAKIAVVHEDARITYGELERLSNKLARVLGEEGVKRGDKVGIYLNKSIKSVISIFGILKANAVYVPIDPFCPSRRLAYIIKDCRINHLITSGDKLTTAFEVFGARPGPALGSIVLTEDGRSLDQSMLRNTRVIPWGVVEGSLEVSNPVNRIKTDLAYILYTSGSTGTPKGVMISHRAAFTFIDWTYDYFAISEKDVVSNHAPLHFDLSIFDIFTTIKAGGTVVLVPERMSTFPVTLSQFIRDQGITVWYSVPSALILLLVRGNFAKQTYPALRLILFAGEVFPIKYLRALRESTTARLFNLYGPTETNVCTFYEVTNLPPNQVQPVPIGSAIANYEVFAINEERNFIKPGEVGELYARGPGLMSGYWGDLEKTRKVLVPSPFQSASEEKVCRTGDLVTIDKDGNYDYVGRRDHMIKSRGYRIELGEIETILYSHPRIRETAVVAIPDEQVTTRLKAFVVSAELNGLTAHEVQKYCTDRLPKYMVPEMVEFRESLPKTSTGKVDRKSLTEP